MTCARTLFLLRSQSQAPEVGLGHISLAMLFNPLQMFSHNSPFLAAKGSGMSPAATETKPTRDSEWTSPGSGNAAHHVPQAPSGIRMVYLGSGAIIQSRPPAPAHMFLYSCVSISNRDSQNEDPKIQAHKDLEYLRQAIFELGNIPSKCVVSLFCCLFLASEEFPWQLFLILTPPPHEPPLGTFPCKRLRSGPRLFRAVFSITCHLFPASATFRLLSLSSKGPCIMDEDCILLSSPGSPFYQKQLFHVLLESKAASGHGVSRLALSRRLLNEAPGDTCLKWDMYRATHSRRRHTQHSRWHG